MQTGHTELSKYVAAVMSEKNLSGYAVERATHRKITQSFINRIRTGEVKTPSAAKLNELAKGLGVPASELFAKVGSGKINSDVITNERLRAIDAAYKSLSKASKTKADFLIELIEREIKRL